MMNNMITIKMITPFISEKQEKQRPKLKQKKKKYKHSVRIVMQIENSEERESHF